MRSRSGCAPRPRSYGHRIATGQPRGGIVMSHNRSLAARAGRWSAGHRKTAIVGWLALVVATVFIGGAVGMNYQRQEDLGTGDSGRADRIIAAGFTNRATENVLVQSRGSV